MNAWTQTVTAKVLGIGVLALLMTIPLLQVSGLVRERQQLRETAIAQIAQGWGGAQVLGGPVLTVPTLRQVAVADNQPPQWRTGSESMLADTLTTDVSLAVQTRRYGIYDAPVFVATVKLETGGAARTFTLTKLAWQGDQRVAQVHNEGPNSPPVGRFEGTGGQGEVKGDLVSGHSVYKVEFKLRR